MKEGWKIKTLGEISVRMADGPFGSNLKKEHYTDNKEVRIIQLSNIGEEGWREENSKYTTFKHLETISRSEVFPNDIVIAKMMPAGRAIICPNHEKKFVLSSDAVKVEIKKGLDLRFVLYSINSPYFRSQVYENVTGSGRVRTSLTKLRNCVLRLPSLTEQQRIVTLLDAAFAKIDALKANAEKNLQNAKDLFQAALKKELEPKEGWKTMKLGEFAKMKAGDFVKASDIHSEYFEGSYPCYGGNGFRGYVKEPNKDGEYCLIGRQGALCGNVHIAIGVFRATEHAVVVTPYEPIPILLEYYLLVGLNLNQFSTGAAQPGLSVGNISDKAFISVPPKKQQCAIANRLDALNNRCKQLQENYTKTIALCDDLKQALLTKAFNGEL